MERGSVALQTLKLTGNAERDAAKTLNLPELFLA